MAFDPDNGDVAKEASLEDLAGAVVFVADLQWRSKDAVERFESGQLVEKSGGIFAGTRRITRPVFPERLLVFAKSAAVADPDIDDPWELAAIDRKAYFAVGDVYDGGDVVQYALLEIGEDEAADGRPIVFDAVAREYARGLLEGSRGAEPPAHYGDPAFLEMMGNEREEYRWGARWCMELIYRLDRKWLLDYRAGAEEQGVLAERRAALVQRAPEHDFAGRPDGTVQCCAARRRDDGDEALACIEAQRNLEILCGKVLSRALVRHLYAGNRLPADDALRAAVAHDLAFHPAGQLTCDPWLSWQRQEALLELDERYDERRLEDPDSVIDLDSFRNLRGRLEAMFDGDSGACVEALRDRLESVDLPYRYEFSCGLATINGTNQ